MGTLGHQGRGRGRGGPTSVHGVESDLAIEASIRQSVSKVFSYDTSLLLPSGDEATDRESFIAFRWQMGLVSQGSAAVLHPLLLFAGQIVSKVVLAKQLKLVDNSVHAYVSTLRHELDRLELHGMVETLRSRGYRISSVNAALLFQYLGLNQFPDFAAKRHSTRVDRFMP
jgi:biotin operon repressor